jgi:predicted sugar kinase
VINIIRKKENNHIDETKLNKKETQVFISMLMKEKVRHINETKIAEFKEWLYETQKLKSTFWKLQKENHIIDSMKIQKCIDYLVNKFDEK